MEFTGNYPDNWAGYVFLQWSYLGYWHEGVDYNWGAGNDDYGRPIYVANDGVIDWVGEHFPGYGYHMFVKHEDDQLGVIYTHYAHLKSGSALFAIGDLVKCGDQIAQCGNTGWNNMYAHLHFEVRKPIGGGYGFWPDPQRGWNPDKIKQYYFDPYLFVEDKIAKYKKAMSETNINDLLQKLNNANLRIDSLSKENTALKAQVNTLTQENANLRYQVTDLTKKLDDCRKKISGGSGGTGSTGSTGSIFGDLLKKIWG